MNSRLAIPRITEDLTPFVLHSRAWKGAIYYKFYHLQMKMNRKHIKPTTTQKKMNKPGSREGKPRV